MCHTSSQLIHTRQYIYIWASQLPQTLTCALCVIRIGGRERVRIRRPIDRLIQHLYLARIVAAAVSIVSHQPASSSFPSARESRGPREPRETKKNKTISTTSVARAARNKASRPAQARGPRWRRQANQRTRKGHTKEKKVKVKIKVKIKVNSVTRRAWRVGGYAMGRGEGEAYAGVDKSSLVIFVRWSAKKEMLIKYNVLFSGDVSPPLNQS